MIVDCKHKKEAFQSIFEFMNYAEFVLGQKFSYKKKDLSKYYFHAYCVLLNDMLANSNANLHKYAKLKHNVDLNFDVKSSIKKIKKKFILGNKVDYRFVLVAQLLHALELLNINTLKEDDKLLLQKKLCFSKKNFALALEYAKDHSKIKSEKILKTFMEHVNFKKSHNKYKQTKIKHIGICANMSCGKSTFVNALLGNDYLPARNEATTACVTSVYDYDNAKSMIGVAIKNDHIYAIGDNMDTVAIDKWNAEADHIILESDLDNISNSNVVVAVHDTPGVNNSSNDNHGKITMDFLSQNKMDAILYVANAEQLGTTDEDKLLKELLKLNAPFVIFVLNKADSIDTEKESMDKIIEDFRKQIVKIGYDKNSKIFPISSKAARLFKMALKGDADKFSASERASFVSLFNYFLDNTDIAGDIAGDDEQDEEIMIGKNAFTKKDIEKALSHSGLTNLENEIENLLGGTK